jgi:hypothetical protein
VRSQPEVKTEGQREALARQVANRLKNYEDANQDLLSDLCDGETYEALANRHTRGNVPMVRERIAKLFDSDHLDIPFLPMSADARELLDRAFDLMEEMG